MVDDGPGMLCMAERKGLLYVGSGELLCMIEGEGVFHGHGERMNEFVDGHNGSPLISTIQ